METGGGLKGLNDAGRIGIRSGRSAAGCRMADTDVGRAAAVHKEQQMKHGMEKLKPIWIEAIQ